jgi:hypothetical protein
MCLGAALLSQRGPTRGARDRAGEVVPVRGARDIALTAIWGAPVMVVVLYGVIRLDA